ncbi:MAG TPA: Abi-alpha family protein, partial [Jatrophihabitantaceae bacterium]|nr:Abi-alpha family protein [Jatrophihabitantaceae bacterium]
MTDECADRRETGLVRDLPGLARVVTTSYWRALSWTVGSTVNAGTHVLKRTLDGDSPAQILLEATADLRSIAGRLWGVTLLERDAVAQRDVLHSSTAELRAMGAELLNRSADVNFPEDMHPAYARILTEVTPDEARILRLLAQKGPQPSVDVRTNRPLGIGSELVASGLSMIGEHAGCRNVDRTNAYLNNLFRLGLVWFSRESIDPRR